MKLTDLNPRWCTAVEGRRGMGLTFLCPVHRDHRLAVMFINPTDGKEPDTGAKFRWQRTGGTFDTLTLGPSVDASGNVMSQRVDNVGMIETPCWHGFITNGEVT